MLAMHPSTSITVGTLTSETNGLGLQHPSQLAFNGCLLYRRWTGSYRRTELYVYSRYQIHSIGHNYQPGLLWYEMRPNCKGKVYTTRG